MHLPVYVMIGGRSRRFGSDKATHPVDGEPWALHVGHRLTDCADKLTLVGPDAPAATLGGVRFVRDLETAAGPLAGVAAAIEDRVNHLGEGLLVLASCDLVRPEQRWLAPLIATHESTADLEVAAYIAAERWQPFPAVVHTRWQARLAASLAEGCRSFQRAFDQSNAEPIRWPNGSDGPPQANTPDELHRLADGA